MNFINKNEIDLLITIIKAKKKISFYDLLISTNQSNATLYRTLATLQKLRLIKHQKQIGKLGCPPKFYYSTINELLYIINKDGIDFKIKKKSDKAK